MDNYPLGADQDPNAPWKEQVIPEKNFTVFVSQSLSKSFIPVKTNDYNKVCYKDEDGCACIEINTENTNWEETYNNTEHYTPIELIDYLKDLLQILIEKKDESEEQLLEFSQILSECNNWYEDETIIIRDDNT